MVLKSVSAIPSSLRIAVLGAGKIGSTFAFQLAGAGHHDVTVIARPGSIRLKQLERDGAIIDVKSERANVRVSSALDQQIPYDLVIVTVMSNQVGDVLPALRRSAARCIQFMFNTFHPDRLQEAIGEERCTFGMPFVQATLTADGKLKATVGAGGQRSRLSQRRWVDVFNAAGLPAVLEREMQLWLRCHVPLCVAFESVSVAGERRRAGATWAEALVLARGVHASLQLIKSLGYGIYPRSKTLIAASPVPILAVVLWGLSRIRAFRELLATGEVECAALVDDMVAAVLPTTSAKTVSAIRAMKPA